MSESPLRENHAVNFKIPGEAKLIHFLADWLELDVSKVFTLTVVTPGNGEPSLVQVVPRGKSAAEDETYFHLLERSLDHRGMLEFWRQNAEFLPRIALGSGHRERSADSGCKQPNHAE